MSDWLELHHINVIGGDATLVVVRGKDGGAVTTKFRALIDSGEEGDGARWLASYLVNSGEIEPGKPDRPDCDGTPNKCYFDLIVVTHMHADHIRGFPKMGWAPAWYVDTTAEVTGVRPTYPDIGVTKGNARDSVAYKFFIEQAVTAKTTKRISLPFTEMAQKDETGAVDLIPKITSVAAGALKMTVVCANGVMAGLPARDGGTATARKDLFALKVNDKNGSLGAGCRPHARQTYLKGSSPNDFSIGTFIEWGDFRYFTSGDLSGDSDGNDAGPPSYKDLESYVIADLKAAGWIRPDKSKPGIDAVKIAHHGSGHSTFVVKGGASFLGEVRPAAMVVPTNQKKWVPGMSYLQRAANYVIDRRKAASSKVEVPGLLLANQTSFWSGNPDYDEMNRVELLSTCGTRASGQKDFLPIPFNGVSKVVHRANGKTEPYIDNNPAEAVVIVAGADAPTLDKKQFGQTKHRFANFVVDVRISGPENVKKIVLKKRSYEVIDLDYVTFNLKSPLTESFMKKICGQVYDKATLKAVQAGSDSAADRYMKIQYPAVYGLYVSAASNTKFAQSAAGPATANIESCYVPNDERTRFELKGNYKDNDLATLQTVKSLVQSAFSSYLGLVVPNEESKRRATRKRLWTMLDASAVTDGNRVKKVAKKGDDPLFPAGEGAGACR